jgi:hypothetical protein
MNPAIAQKASKGRSQVGMIYFPLRGSGLVFASRSISLSAPERFPSAPISRAFSMKAFD